MPTNGKPVERAPETLTHPASGFVNPQRGTVSIAYYRETPYPAGEFWWVGRGDGQLEELAGVDGGR